MTWGDRFERLEMQDEMRAAREQDEANAKAYALEQLQQRKVKTKKAMQPYTCHDCKRLIAKGEQYARRVRVMGSVGLELGNPDNIFWEPWRIAMPICSTCINLNPTEK
jgi:hypothetical protein